MLLQFCELTQITTTNTKIFVLPVVYLVFPEPVYAGPDKVQYFSEPNVQVISTINNN